MKIVLSIAGSEPTGGAGLQLDLKVLAACGVDGAAVPTLITVQGANGIRAADPVDAARVEEQIEAVFEQHPVAAVKTGALGASATVLAIARCLERHPEPPLVLDTVISASTGGGLLDGGAMGAVREFLLPRATLVTPNLLEAGAYSGEPVSDRAGMERAAGWFLDRGSRAALIKGGHLQSDLAADFLSTRDGASTWIEGERLDGAERVHGTGCALSSAIAAALARGLELETACRRAKAALFDWLRSAEGERLLPEPFDYMSEN